MYKIILNLKVHRLERQIKQKDLAIKIGVSASYISQIESHKKSPNLKIIEKIANVLEMHPFELLEISSHPVM